jgi:hypothetical protein
MRADRRLHGSCHSRPFYLIRWRIYSVYLIVNVLVGGSDGRFVLHFARYTMNKVV